MKKLYVVLLLLISQQLFSQHVSSGIGKWKLGLNVGATWQTADVNTDLFDLGYGATLEYALYEKRSSFFGFSLRGRFLQGKTTGYDCLKNNGTISNNAINGSVDTSFNYSSSPLYLNNRTSLNEFSLEAMLKWNKLYQNHGILFYLYLGGGFTSYKVETDQLNTSNDLYDYSFITDNNGSSTINEIKNLQDGVYETELNHPDYNTLVFTPAVGIGLGYRITPGVDFAIEHKISLPQTDLFDGQIHDSDDPSFIQDIYHYTSLGIIFCLVGHSDPETYTPPVEPTEPTTLTPVTTTPIKPVITITHPTTNTFNTPNCKVEIIAKIENVGQQKDITFYHNGNKVPSYKYFFSPPTFKSTIELEDGNNNFKIIAKNDKLSDIEEFSLKCNNVNTIDICHKKLDGTYITLNIKESEWNDHKGHGDNIGACPEKQITICHNISGQPGKTQTINIAESKWAIHKSHGDYLGDCKEKKMISICHNNQLLTIDEKDWATHAAHGDIKGPCPQVNMITICHIPPTGNKRQTLSIPENEWIVHQAHGDTKGTCPTTEPTTTICHKNDNGTKTTMTIPEFRWNEHFSHGDAKGNCPESSFIICHKDPSTGKKQNISIYESAWSQHAVHGDTKGACPEKQITICHNIPGQPGKTQTISIPESKWLIHKSHGDVKGTCSIPQKKITICHKQGPSKTTMIINASEWATHAAHGDIKGQCVITPKRISICHNEGDVKTNITINENDWPSHAAHGDTKGICPKPEKQLIICHNIPGKAGSTQTISIPESKWLIHKSHGDKLGACSEIDKDIQICHKDQQTGKKTTITIKESQWPIHASHGDKKGKCSSLGTTGNPSGDITICHYPPNDPNNPQTITIPAGALDFHIAHGDSQGPCPDNGSDGGNPDTGDDKKITICHKPLGKNSNPQTIQISQSAWPAHQSHGDYKGECIDTSSTGINNPTTIKICHYPPGNTNNPQEITIPLSAWPAHKAHGDTKGDCTSGGKKKTNGKGKKGK